MPEISKTREMEISSRAFWRSVFVSWLDGGGLDGFW